MVEHLLYLGNQGRGGLLEESLGVGREPCSENTTWLQLLQADKFCSTIQTHLSNPFYLLSERMFNAQINISSDSDKAAKMSTMFALQLAQGGWIFNNLTLDFQSRLIFFFIFPFFPFLLKTQTNQTHIPVSMGRGELSWSGVLCEPLRWAEWLQRASWFLYLARKFVA